MAAFDEAVSEASGGRGWASLSQSQKDALTARNTAGEFSSMGTASSTGLTEPSVISTSAARDNFESEVQPDIDAARKAQQTTFENLQNRPEPVQPSAEQLMVREGESDLEKIQRQKQDLLDQQKQDIQNTYDQMVTLNIERANAQKNALTAQWEERRRILEQSNRANLATWQQQFIRSGQAEYSPGMTSDFIAAKEQEGLRKLKQLDNQYNSAVAQIEAALADNNFRLAAQKRDELRAIEFAALEQAEANAKEAAAVNDAFRERQNEISRDLGVASLLMQGITDPSKMLSALNGAGLDVTASEINGAIDSLREKLDTQLTETVVGGVKTRMLIDKNTGRTIRQIGPTESEMDVLKQQLSINKLQAEIDDIFTQRQERAEDRALKREEIGLQASKQMGEAQLEVRKAVRAEPLFGPFEDFKNAYINVQQGVELGNAQGDLAIVNGIAKMLDPGSVIRPSEFETVQQAQSFFERNFNVKFYLEGNILTETSRDEFQELADKLLISKGEPVINTLESVYQPITSNYGIEFGQAVPEVGQIKSLIDTARTGGVGLDDPFGGGNTLFQNLSEEQLLEIAEMTK